MSIGYSRAVGAGQDEPVDWRTAPRRPATDEEARALASTLRMRILRVCLDTARTNKEIAGILGKDPATTLHHVRRLVDTGFLEPQPVRRGSRGSRERPYLATRKSWKVSNPAQSTVLLDAFLEEAALVPIDQLDTARLGLRLTPDRMAELMDRLGELLDEFSRDPDDPAAEPMSLFLAVHPDPNRPG
jgi:DNA-binding MarR family transcriptional regulator